MNQTLSGVDYVNEVVNALKNVVPLEFVLQDCEKIARYESELPIEISIGTTGNLKGELSIRTTPEFLSEVGVVMYGMPIGEEMIESFAGEFLNTVAGRFCSLMADMGITLDISVPTVRLQVKSHSSVNPIWNGDIVVDGVSKLHVLLTYAEK